MNARFWTGLGRIRRRLPALAVGILAFYVGIGIGVSATLRSGVLPDSGQLIPLVMMVGIWAVGLIVAVRLWRWAKQKDDAHRAA
jgi:divalent metal cation (Fe/Co/Zn/Cd) transporter